ncbi:MAG: peptidyl-prolyl cis-trans isomerase [Nitrospinae bacterium]|nr:peptidyl-prolyl cis-trans isomerase [Nitrospinota bacterium]
MFRQIILAAALAAAMLASGCSWGKDKESASPAGMEKTVAKVGNKTLSAAQYDLEVRKYKSMLQLDKTGAMTAPQAEHLEKSVLNRMIDDLALEAEAEKEGVTISKDELEEEIRALVGEYDEASLKLSMERGKTTLEEWKTALEKNMRIKKLVSREVDQKIKVSEDEIRQYFSENAREFRWPERVRVAQIMLTDEIAAAEAKRLVTAGDDFALIAKKYSQSPDAQTGGDLGYYAKGQLPPEFEHAVFGLKEGNISDVVRSTYGYHIFRVLKRETPRAMKMEEARGNMVEILTAKKREKEFADWLSKVKNSLSVTVYPEALPQRPRR